MQKISHYILTIALVALSGTAAKSQIYQNFNKTSGEIQIGLQKLNTLGSVLYLAAHPDDENTRLIAWLAQEKKYNTAYLSLTRGDGGQNLLGKNLGVDLGLIRTHELLQARAIDKGQQFFSSALDFGFSKTHQETFSFWDQQQILQEAVWIIRKFKPDVIITRFPPDERAGHGHHQASAIIAHQAFLAAADPTAFAHQLDSLETWQAKRIVWNAGNFGGQDNTNAQQLQVDIGQYNAILGLSYGEIAAHSRSQHKSQGFGSLSSRGSSIEYFQHVDGKKAQNSLMDGVITSWQRIPHSQAVQQLIRSLNANYNPARPEACIAGLEQLLQALEHFHIDPKDPDASTYSYYINKKKQETIELLLAATGLYIDAYTSPASQSVNQSFPVQLQAIYRNKGPQVQLLEINGQPIAKTLDYNSPLTATTSLCLKQSTQPYYLQKPYGPGRFDIPLALVGYPSNPEPPAVDLLIAINGRHIPLKLPVFRRYLDPVHGEQHDPLVVTPALTLETSTEIALSENQQTKTIELTFNRHHSNLDSIQVHIERCKDWIVMPSMLTLHFDGSDQIRQTIRVKPKNKNSKRSTLSFSYNKQPLYSMRTLEYEHIPSITWFPRAQVTLENLQLENPITHIAYLPGAGDMIPQALEQIGIKTTTLAAQDLRLENLRQYQAIVLGVRYFNLNKANPSALNTLLDYVKQGGVLLAQYNVSSYLSDLSSTPLGPYPFTLTPDRVTMEDAPVALDASDPALSYPNKISQQDFQGWKQERGLYFATDIDPRYRTPLRMSDSGEQPLEGSLLITKLGKGKFVYTSLSFFRQLPAAVPGAYRLFVNLLTNEK